MDNVDSPMGLQLKISFGNEAMQTPSDAAEALRAVADRIEGTGTFDDSFRGSVDGIPIRDINGNIVGSWSIE